MDIAVLVTLAIFIAGVIYHSGQLSSRVDNLETWRTEVKDDIKTIRAVVDRVDGALHDAR